MASYLSERVAIVGAYAPIDATGATPDATCINMKKYKRAAFLLYFGELTGTDTMTVKAYEAASDTQTTAIAARYKVATTGTTAKSVLDGNFTAMTAASGFTVAGTQDNKIYVVEILDQDMDAGYPYASIKITTGPGAHACLCTIIALAEGDYAQAMPPDPTA